MHNVLLVHVVEGQAELLDHRGCLALIECALLHDLLKEVAAGHELHDNIIVARVFHELKHSRDVRVHCILQHCELILVQLLVDVGDFQALLLDNLDGTWDT